jgi:AraC-like DNA-binding protein
MSVSIIFARALVAEFETRGLSPTELFQQTRFEAARLSNIREKLSTDELARLTATALEMSDDPGLGLALGCNAPLNSMQLLSSIMLTQRTIRDAFATFKRYSALISQGPSFQLIEQSDTATWAVTPGVAPCDFTRVLVDYGMVLAARIGRELRPPGAALTTRLLAVHFQHQEPSYSDRYAAIFQCPVLFRQKVNGLVFPRSILDHEQAHADETVGTLLRDATERLLRESVQELTWSERTRAALHYPPGIANATVERVASSLNVSPRSLGRRLRAEGSSFSGLLDEARRRVACEQLGRADVTTQEVAELLGFSEASAFFRAFKRWTGCTPSEYRRRMRGASASDAALGCGMS